MVKVKGLGIMPNGTVLFTPVDVSGFRFMVKLLVVLVLVLVVVTVVVVMVDVVAGK